MLPKETYRYIIATLADYAVFTMDLSGVITSWNEGCQNIIGYESDEVVGKTGEIIFSDEDKKNNIFGLEVSKALKDGKAEDERWHIRKDGSPFWASGMMMTYKNDQGEVIGLVKILRDRTEQRIMRNELERSNEDLEQFAFVIAHDFKSPLNLIDSYMALLLQEVGPLPEKALTFSKFIQDKVQLLKKMVERFLSFAKANHSPVKFSQTDLNDVCTQAVTSILEEVKQRNAQVKWEFLPHVWGDGALLVMLFQNLILNAIKYNDKIPEINITCAQKQQWYVVSIQDNGVGIAPENRQRIFSPFFQVNENENGGHGLGLATVRKIVEFHGGRIWVESEMGKGSIFHFTLKGGAEE